MKLLPLLSLAACTEIDLPMLESVAPCKDSQPGAIEVFCTDYAMQSKYVGEQQFTGCWAPQVDAWQMLEEGTDDPMFFWDGFYLAYEGYGVPDYNSYKVDLSRLREFSSYDRFQACVQVIEQEGGIEIYWDPQRGREGIGPDILLSPSVSTTYGLPSDNLDSIQHDAVLTSLRDIQLLQKNVFSRWNKITEDLEE